MVQDMVYAKRMSPFPTCGYSATALAASCGLTNSTRHRSLPLYAIDRIAPWQPVQSESKNFQFQNILMAFFLEAATKSGLSTELIAYIAIDRIIRKNLTCLSRFCNLFFHRRVPTTFSRILISWKNPRAVEASSVALIGQTIISKSCSGLMPPPCMEICPETCFRAFCGK